MPDPPPPVPAAPHPTTAANVPLLVTSWLWVGIPLAWGVWQTVRQSLALFR